MFEELEKAYLPKKVESKIYRIWEKSGYFNPDNLPGLRKQTFSIAMPPPNVTGELHLGHATALTIEDLLTRYHRMQGKKTLYLPGTDHAGISTQIMVERLIAKSGLNRHKLGRAEFLKRAWAWKKQYGTRITEQIRQLGTSCDWSRERFTMDETFTIAVQTAFVRMYKDGLIYRGDRIVNWCTRCSSALSDLEVKHQQTTNKLWYIKYPLFGSTKYLVVATTRPETMLGDTAVAVNPKDNRYQRYVGKSILLPITNREIPIITDDRIDMEFGSGVVKVTPAHDHLDYEIGADHKLETINVIGQDGRMTKEAGEFYGQSIQEARHQILQRLENEELLEKTINYIHNLARCDRCGSPIEPLISKQWFIKTKILAKPAIAAVKSGQIKIIPKRFEKVYFHWMNNIKDWCISRQLWWGHQIPVWYRGNQIRASIKKPSGQGWQQDEDTLDTWFSSGLWTFSTLGWPKKTKDLKLYHPTSVIETGWDILFFWVARMTMMSLYFMKEVPFKTVYLHGLVLDRHGKKMSKSKGTGVDPIPMTEKYGTDAIRLSLILGTTAGQDFRLYEEKIAGYRNFINKLWNVSRFILSQKKSKGQLVLKSTADHWIINRLNRLISTVTKHIENHRFSDAGAEIYGFLWHEFADWYLEISKLEKNLPMLNFVLENILKLAHPFIPFVTEEIWSRWKGGAKKNLLMIQDWPHVDTKQVDKKTGEQFQLVINLIASIRNFRAEHKIAPSKKISVYYWGKQSSIITDNAGNIAMLTHLEDLGNQKQKKSTGSLPGLDFYIDFKQDEATKKKEINNISQYIQKLESKLSNKKFLNKKNDRLKKC